MGLLEKLLGGSKRGKKTAKDVQNYVSQRYDLLKLELLDKSSQILSVILSMLIVVVCALAVLIYLSNALISWLTIVLNAGWAYAIVCAPFILIILVVLRFKDTLFVNAVIRKFSRILYPDEETSEGEVIHVPDIEEEGGDNE